jgi:hypothetical protein
MNPHLQLSADIYEKQGTDLQKLIGWHLCHGVVICNPFVFALCHHADSRDLPGAVEFHHSDTLFVTFCAGSMRFGLAPFVDRYRFIAFQRQFKNSPRIRLLDMGEFYKKLT